MVIGCRCICSAILFHGTCNTRLRSKFCSGIFTAFNYIPLEITIKIWVFSKLHFWLKKNVWHISGTKVINNFKNSFEINHFHTHTKKIKHPNFRQMLTCLQKSPFFWKITVSKNHITQRMLDFIENKFWCLPLVSPHKVQNYFLDQYTYMNVETIISLCWNTDTLQLTYVVISPLPHPNPFSPATHPHTHKNWKRSFKVF